MGTIFTQTDSILNYTVVGQCATATDGDAPTIMEKASSSGGTAGSTEVSPSLIKTTTCDAIFIDTPEVSSPSWPGGTGNEITFRLDVTTPDGTGSLQVVAVTACRIDSSGIAQGTYGTWTGTRTLNATQVESFTLTTTAQSANMTDHLLFIVQMSNVGHSTYSVGITPSQNIDTAITPIVAGQVTMAVTTELGTATHYFALSSVTLPSDDYYSSMILQAANPSGLRGHRVGCIARGASNGNGYVAGYNAGTSEWFIAKSVGAALTDLVTYSEAFPAGGTAYVTFDVTGTTLTLNVNGTQKAQTTDSTYTTGSVGVYGLDTMNVTYDTGIAIGQWGVMGPESVGQSASLIVSASLTANASLIKSASTSLTVNASLTAVSRLVLSGISTLTSNALFTANGELLKLGSASLGVTAGLNAVPSGIIPGATQLSITASLTAISALIRGAAMTAGVTVTLAAVGTMVYAATSTQAVQVTMDAKPSANWVDSAVLIVNSSLSGADADLVAYDTFTEVSQTLLSDHVGEYGSWGQSGGNLSLQIDSNGKLRLDL